MTAEDIAYFVIVVICSLIYVASMAQVMPANAFAALNCPTCEVPPQTAWVGP